MMDKAWGIRWSCCCCVLLNRGWCVVKLWCTDSVERTKPLHCPKTLRQINQNMIKTNKQSNRHRSVSPTKVGKCVMSSWECLYDFSIFYIFYIFDIEPVSRYNKTKLLHSWSDIWLIYQFFKHVDFITSYPFYRSYLCILFLFYKF